jgi:enterobactin synthetase component D / holo-[acyl-carrier protein] synthase
VSDATLLGTMLPAAVQSAESFDDPADVFLFPEEAAAVAKAVAKRRREFATVRHCARRALAGLGRTAVPLLPGLRGAPGWPQGVVGSMTHCDGYRAAAVAHHTDVVSLGIDAEPNGPLPDGVLDSVTLPHERQHLAELAAHTPSVHWDRLLFSAKETVYKAWYPYHHRMLGFHEAELLFTADPGASDRGGYTARVLLPGPLLAPGTGPDVFTGRWVVRDGLLATAIAVPAA